MEIEPTLDGLDLCVRNALRLFEDSCTQKLSLPTVGAILEIGLEEAVKGFLILICLEKNVLISGKTLIDLDKSLSDFIVSVREFNNKIDCQKQLVSAFRKHKVKTNILNFLGGLIRFVPPESVTIKDFTKDFLNGLNANLGDDSLEKLLSSPSLTDFISQNMNATQSVLMRLSGKIKESGFYVDWIGSCFRYPEIDNNTILRMANFLFSVIAGFKMLTGLLQIKLQTKLDVSNLYKELTVLEDRLK